VRLGPEPLAKGSGPTRVPKHGPLPHLHAILYWPRIDTLDTKAIYRYEDRIMGRDIVPVVLFTYKRDEKLKQVLDALRQNRIPLLIVYSDGPKDDSDNERVEKTRSILRGIDWCRTVLHERDCNYGLGRSILQGVGEVLREYGEAIVFEDDIVASPGAYAYFCEALRAYRNDRRVYAVSGYTHPALVPSSMGADPYFDSRYCCWGWATWERSWRAMKIPSLFLLLACAVFRRPVTDYGKDLVPAGLHEFQRSTWAARFAILGMLRGQLSLHSPWSLTTHLGFDDSSTTTGVHEIWDIGSLRATPSLPVVWPKPAEAEGSAARHERLYGSFSSVGAQLIRELRATWWMWMAERRGRRQGRNSDSKE